MSPPILTLKNIHLTFGGTPLLEGAEISVSKGDRICLVGRNGSGKTTLFNYLTQNNLYVADKPFATLDSVTRKNDMPQLRNILFSE